MPGGTRRGRKTLPLRGRVLVDLSGKSAGYSTLTMQPSTGQTSTHFGES
jgi:hypothetical protein